MGFEECIISLTPILSSALKAADSFSSHLKSTLPVVQAIGNLGEQFQSLESITAKHPLVNDQPDLLSRLSQSIQASLEDEAEKISSIM